MGVTFEVDPAHPDPAALEAAAEALAAGGLVVLPTETVYGIAARPDLPTATERLFEAKRRPASLTLPVLAASESEAWTVVKPTPGATLLAAAFWPGALTLVLPRTTRSREWRLGDRRDTIALRVPDHAIATTLLRRTGVLAVTSANISGQAPISDRAELESTFADRAEVILALPGGVAPPGGVPSTVVDCTRNEIRVLRDGAIPEVELRAAWSDRTASP